MHGHVRPTRSLGFGSCPGTPGKQRTQQANRPSTRVGTGQLQTARILAADRPVSSRAGGKSRPGDRGMGFRGRRTRIESIVIIRRSQRPPRSQSTDQPPFAFVLSSGNCFCSCSRWMMMVGFTRISST